jgi:hypothetical protein
MERTAMRQKERARDAAPGRRLSEVMSDPTYGWLPAKRNCITRSTRGRGDTENCGGRGRESARAVAQAIVTRRAETRRQYRGAPFAQRR